MKLANLVRAAETPILSPELFRPSSGSKSDLRSVFVGPNGLRAGWRLLIFIAIVGVLLASFVLVRSGGVQGFLNKHKNAGPIIATPLLLGGSEAVAVLALCIAALIMGRIEHRKFSEYGLPWRQALGKDFWSGALWGFVALSGTLLTIFLLHGFRITGLALHGRAILFSVLEWGVVFLLVGLFEEFLCRGYVQYTLASGIGFWPAALVISGLFGFAHAFNPGETAIGALAAGLFGLLFCLFLRRTGNLWMAVGFHAAWDWGQTFFGVADSGMLSDRSVFHSMFSGPGWLTGGTVGPEASIFTPIALLVAALIFSRYYREDRYRVLKPSSSPVTAS
jgi:CAAX protease family protein